MIRGREALLLNATCFLAGGFCGMAAIGITPINALAALRFLIPALAVFSVSMLAIRFLGGERS